MSKYVTAPLSSYCFQESSLFNINSVQGSTSADLSLKTFIAKMLIPKENNLYS